MSSLPQALAAHRELDRWVRVDASATITVFTGKVELGQGLLGALARIAADELDVALTRVRVESADTRHGLDERFTAGSLSMMDSGTALRQAACEVRALLLELAAERLGVAIERLEVSDGTITAAGNGGSVSYWELSGGRPLRRLASGTAKPKPARSHRVVGSGARNRFDLRGLIDGTTRFVGDLTRDGMLHGRVVRPPSPSARLLSLEDGPVRELDGVVAVVRRGSFVGVLAEREQQAVGAAELARMRARWAHEETLPDQGVLATWLRAQPDEAFLISDGAPVAGAPAPERGDGVDPLRKLQPPVFDARLDRPLGRDGALGCWQPHRLDPQPGRLRVA